MHTSIHLSAYFLVVMSAEKCFALYFPLQAKNFCTIKNSIVVSIITAAVFSIYNIQWFFTIEKVYVMNIKRMRCQIINAPDFLRFHWGDIDAIIASYVPMGLMLAFNLAIIILLCKNRGKDLGVGSTSRDIVRVPRVGPPLHRGPLGFWQFSEAGRRNIACSVICPLHYQSTWFVLTNRSEASHYREVYEDGKFFLFQIFWISAKSTVSGASFAKPFSYS